ncbi:FBXO42 [Lepeophtheirus salmonis]|uniref:FBXO42 n=1 Tax=Lepeophtheirus salmonis TaxID=72036 RepID=A0A7R8CEV5_LEPSM|nr:FBXO42 [Lepeophtheirus salmonis]CAF2799565.1 FBXO42 [Lepeophtheirus salmonis]
MVRITSFRDIIYKSPSPLYAFFLAVIIKGMEDLPDEVLESILGKVNPYEDAENCALVCSRWRRVMLVVRQRRKGRFMSGLLSGSLCVSKGRKAEKILRIAKRYSHSAIYYDKGLFVFGGCTSTSTTFNDLWRLDLSTRTWMRTSSTGRYPSPKACASLVLYEEELYLFGGWSSLSPYRLIGSWKLLNELHVYNPLLNKWTLFEESSESRAPPCSAGHTASIHGEAMIVFGGLQKSAAIGNFSKEHLLIIGGCDSNGVFHDVWLFDMSKEPWKWYRCEVANPQYGANDSWCHPAFSNGRQWNINPDLRRGMNRGDGAFWHHNRRREDFADPVPEPPSNEVVQGHIIRPDPYGERMKAFTIPVNRSKHVPTRKSLETRQKQLDVLKKMEDRLLKFKAQETTENKAISNRVVSWLQIKTSYAYQSPEETLLYSLVTCRSELVMFGGIQMEASSARSATPDQTKESVSNTTYYFSPFHEII